MVPITLLGWIPVVICLFALLPPRRAIITAFLAAWLFLPVAGYSIVGLPDYTKMSATCVGVLLCTVLFDAQRLISFRPRWVDAPMIAWVLIPFATSLSNGLGAYDGLSASLEWLIAWGLPYFIGRMYFTDVEGLRELAVGIFVGGLLYVPLCLFEIRMSPQLHNWMYGFHQHDFQQTKRFGGFRPTVFMEHGLMVGLWMTSAALVGIWMWLKGGLRSLVGIPMSVLVPVQLATTVLCKSAGALVLLVAGLGCMFGAQLFRMRAIMIAAVLVAPLFIAARIQGWSAQHFVEMAAAVSPDRAQSLQARIDNERMLLDKAAQRPILGWGGWGRNLVYDYRGRQLTIADSLWIIALAKNGLMGLVAVFAAMLVPTVRALVRLDPCARWSPAGAPVVALAGTMVVYAADKLFNAMLNPVFLVVAGGLAGASLLAGQRVVEPGKSVTAGVRGTVLFPGKRAREEEKGLSPFPKRKWGQSLGTQ
jgi:hypothetical protein